MRVLQFSGKLAKGRSGINAKAPLNNLNPKSSLAHTVRDLGDSFEELRKAKTIKTSNKAAAKVVTGWGSFVGKLFWRGLTKKR